MYSEQLAVLLFIAATQMAGQGVATEPMVQRGGVEKSVLRLKQDRSLINARMLSNRAKREREAMLLAGFER